MLSNFVRLINPTIVRQMVGCICERDVGGATGHVPVIMQISTENTKTEPRGANGMLSVWERSQFPTMLRQMVVRSGEQW